MNETIQTVATQPFVKELGKQFALAAAVSLGSMVGLAAIISVPVLVASIQDAAQSKKTKKNEEE